MTIAVAPPAVVPDIIPETAPFSPEQRQWLNGFFAGLLALDNAQVAAVPAGQAPTLDAAPADETPPWRDPAMAIADRLALAEGRPVAQRLFAAMAQQDCGQCGYLCQTYSAAIADGTESRLNLCSPGGKETFRALKTIIDEAGSALSIAPGVARPPEPAVAAAVGPAGMSRENPAEVTFVGRRRLNGEGSEKATYHLTFDLGEAGPAYRAGDSFGVFPQNDPALVDTIIALLGADPAAMIEGMTLRRHLLERRALGPAPDALFLLISHVTGGETRAKARALAQGEDPDGDAERLDVFGALFKFRQARLGPEAFVEALDELQPRLYSISSSPKTMPGELTLTVDAVRYAVAGRPRLGVASTWFADRLAPGSRLKAFVQKAHGFALPADPSVPIVMVGPGTGIAPFRAFLMDRKADRAPGRNWLFYGHQRQATDFFYREELEAMKAEGFLNRLSLAWSRDGSEKIYVQDRMRQSGADLWSWIAEGAHLYVCGDAKRMAKDVERALVDIAIEHGKHASDAAVAFVAGLKKAGRYQADVY